jgi:hypothetical protein
MARKVVPQIEMNLQNRDRMFILDAVTARYIKGKAQTLNQTPAELVADFVRRDLAASA